jgi:hypothetical protein
MRLRSPFRLALLATSLAASMFAQDAFSQDAKDIARARERFKEAAALQAAGDFARALEAYKEVALVKSSAQVRFNIASCEEKTGDYLRAMGSYQLALTEATRSNSKDIEGAVQKALTELEPRIPALTVKRGDGAQIAEVTLDGRPLAAPSIGVEFRVNPGPHIVKGTAADREPFTSEFNLADGQHQVVTIALKPRAVEAPTHGAGPVVEPPPDTPPPPPSNNIPLRVSGGILIAGGVANLIAAGVFYGMRQKAISTLNGECGTTHMMCTAPGAQATYDSGKSDSTISTATFIAGLGAAGIGATLIGVSMRKPKVDKPDVGLSVNPGGLSVHGTF